MAGKAASIAISATDNFSKTLTTMKGASQAFRKDLEGTKQKLDALNSTKAEIRVENRLAIQNIKEAEKAVKEAKEGTEEYGKALARLEEAYSDQNRIAANLKLVSDAAKDAEKDLKDLYDTNSKLENRAGAGGGGEGMGAMGALGLGGLTAMVGNALAGAAGTYVSSAYGDNAGTYFSSTLSGLASGASMGAALGSIVPGLGTAIGGVVGGAIGGLVGLVQGKMKVFEKEDDAFKSYYQDLYNEVTNAQAQSIASGSITAGSRERDLVAFRTLLDGDTQAAAEFQRTLIEIGRTPPFSYDIVSDLSRGMLALGYSTEQVEDRISSLADAAFALNMSGSEVSSIVAMMDSAIEMGKVDSRLIRTLAKQGIDVNEALIAAFREEGGGAMLTEEGIQKFLSELGENGATAEQVIDAIYKYMGTKFEGAAAGAAETYEGLLGILDSYKTDMDAAMGEGYNDTRMAGMRDQTDYLKGMGGDMLQDANYMIGQWQASLENLQEEYQRDAMWAVMTGGVKDTFDPNGEAAKRLWEMNAEYQKLAVEGTEEAGAKMGALLAEAQAIAVNEYNASEGAQLQLRSQLDLADQIKNDTGLNNKYWDAGYQMGEQFMLGLKSAEMANKELIDVTGMLVSTNTTSMAGRSRGMVGGDEAAPSMTNQEVTAAGRGRVYGHAYGLDRVPYDDYLMRAHEGERLLTANQARQQDRERGAGTGGVVVHIAELHVREEADVGRIAQEIMSNVARKQMLMA